MQNGLRILHLEDDPLDAEMIGAILKKEGLEPEMQRVEDEAGFCQAIEGGGFDLVLADYQLPSYDGLSALRRHRQLQPHVPFILVTGRLGEEPAVECLQKGATDYVLKQRLSRLGVAVRRALAEAEEQRRHREAQNALKESQDRLRLALEATKTGVWSWDIQHKSLDAQGEAAKIVGSYLHGPLDRDRTRALAGMIDSTDLLRIRKELRRAIQRRKDWNSQFRIVGEDGLQRHLDVRGRVFYNSESQPERISGVCSDITDRRRAEQRLAILFKAIEQSPVGVQITATDGRVKYVNRSSLEMSGCDEADVLGELASVFRLDEESPHLWQVWKQLHEKGVWSAELQSSKQSGQTYWELVMVTPVKDSAGLIVNYLVTQKEISQRKRAEAELRRVHDDYHRLIQSANAAIFGVDLNQRINAWNAFSARVMGCAKHKALGRPLSKFVSASSQTELERFVSAALAGRASRHAQLTFLSRKGKPIRLLLNIMPRHDDDDQVVGAVFIGQDITELHRYRRRLQDLVDERTRQSEKARKEAEEAREHLEAILSSLADGVLVTDLEGRVVTLNPTAEHILGTCSDEMEGRPIASCCTVPSLAEAITQFLANDLDLDTTFDFELNRDGLLRSYQVHASKWTGSHGGRRGLVCVMRDITELRQLDKLKDEFFSTAAHELRTPLTSVVGFAEILLTRDDLDAEQRRRYLQMAHGQAKQLSALVDDLLDLSAFESGRAIRLCQGRVPVAEVLEREVEAFRSATKTDCRLSLPQKGLPEVAGDQNRIAQVIRNLLSNAAKYSAPQDPIEVKAASRCGVVEISVSDSGVGMTEEQLTRAFDKFYRGDSSITAAGGTGLGLSIAKAIVDSHRGRIFLESRPNQGSTVTFTLPVDDEKDLDCGRQAGNA